MSIPAHIEHVFKALDIIERKPVEFEYSRDGKLTHISPSPSPDGQHGRKSALSGAQHELSGEGRPTAGPGTAGAGTSLRDQLVIAQYRQAIYAHERLIEQLYDLLPERVDDAYDLVRAEYLAIHGPRD